ncbi:MAG: UTP--glucose-1-phosphate uridylyltransferase [Candidatus Hydrogenedentota bacterium]
MTITYTEARDRLRRHGQEHILQFWDHLREPEQEALLRDIEEVDLDLLTQLVKELVLKEPAPEYFDRIEPVDVIPPPEPGRPDADAAFEAGEDALRAGRVAALVVAGGQGTRLGCSGPKGAYPIGPITGKSLFEYHAGKLLNIQDHYGCTVPWYIMVSEANNAETRRFFETHDYFGLDPAQVVFFQQAMVPCVDEAGFMLLDNRHRLARNPNGHGGVIPAMVENGICAGAKERGIDVLSYFQVDNWALNVIDPHFIGYHLLGGAEMSSKAHRKRIVREKVGIHCMCDGEYRVIEYSELDRFPQLLETDDEGNPIHFAGNPAIHALSVDFVERVYRNYNEFPWHKAHKKIACVNKGGERVVPETPNGYKFETFVFDALRFIRHDPIVVEIHRKNEYTPIKELTGAGSVEEARRLRTEWWAEWLEAAGYSVPRDENGCVLHPIEISPRFAMTKDEFLRKAESFSWPVDGPLAIGPEGEIETANAFESAR